MTERYQKFISDVKKRRHKDLDNGFSTELEKRDCRMGESYWSARVSIDAFESLVDAHKAYIDAGADIITTNSFATSWLILIDPENIENFDAIKKNIEAALVARDKLGADDVLIAGSLSHQVA